MATPGKLELLPVIKFLKKHDFPSSRASELGVGLGIKKARIEEILQNNPLSSDKVLMGVIQHWLDDDVDQSWTKLADALQLCGYEQAARAITGEQPNSPSGNAPSFSMASLTFLKWKQGREERSLRILDDVCNCWKEIAELIGMSIGQVQAIETSRLHKPMECCRDVFEHWVREGGGDYAASWEGLLTLLPHIQQGRVATQLREALNGGERILII